ncbi:TauD/TfdA family dioxygenase [Actinoplanes sp. TRM 88003]|uniref:TauD/TfdA family dioxygenase n=1 Tax=Paractinoplanes aksuensis TaxID=2939490 RepID=A0ABT1DSV7_9ACTN|nr:TauD/TfdA family dioxygenase [Actinoplanes aksuensis]MCO8273923.1 TauD/TfdA family dioxygenase [Actinoplanes aksuensis]
MIIDASDPRALPVVVHAEPADPGLAELLATRRAELRGLLGTHGAVLLRGFPVEGVADFENVVRGLSGDLLTYAERSSPRHSIKGNVYTSTDYPPEEEIFVHNENSYQATWPRTLYFYCVAEPETQGATPLADIRRVYELIDPAVRDEFARRRWSVVRNFHEEFGLNWREIFGTDDRAAVEAYCAERRLEVEWRGADGMRTRAVRDAVHTHPDSGETVWFNHITFFHHTTLPADVRAGVLELFGEDGLPSNTYYGDGGRIDDDVLDHLRACYRQATVRYDWKRRDVLVVDNMLAAHGREPFTGPRKIAVAMAEPHIPAATLAAPAVG